jgi:signal transduction histidine kinase
VRRRIVGAALASAVLAVVIFAIPLGFAARHLYTADESSELERVALGSAVAVGPNFATGDPAELPVPESGDELAVYDEHGKKVSGVGPAQADAAVSAALNGEVGQSSPPGWVVVAVPVSSGENVVGAVRAGTPRSTISSRAAWTWFGMGVVALLAILVAALLADLLARRLNRPLDRLAVASQRLGEGDFDVRTSETGISEIDRVGEALNITAARLGELVTRERLIAANASHQLRTPLTGLRATLEQALVDSDGDIVAAARRAISAADDMESTIDDLIALARGDDPRLVTDIAPCLDSAQARWIGPLAEVGRPLRLELPTDLPLVLASPKAVVQVLDVLLENALRHGTGRVSITARATGSAVAVDVADSGPGIEMHEDIFARGVSSVGGPGIGLAMARELAQDQGGRLILTQREPAACFTLLLTAATPQAGGSVN